MSDSPTMYRERFAALDGRLAAPEATGELDALKADIGALYKDVEHELQQLDRPAGRGDAA